MQKLTLNRIAILLVTALYAASGFGTTIQKLTFEEIVDHSALIVEAEVLSVTPVHSDDLVYSRVLMRVEDVLKGLDPGTFIELDFLGGSDSEMTIEVSGQDIPQAGEQGFYFIESLSEKRVNPLTGWSQGHFRILTGLKGEQYLETDIQQDLVELTENKNAALANKLRNMKFSHALVEKAWFSPVTPDELREAVRAFLGEQ